MRQAARTLGQYAALIKSLQTALLLITGLAGYMSARCPVTHWTTVVGLLGSLFLAVSGSTILNMCYDRDIDSVMNRTHHRPIASGKVRPEHAARIGLLFAVTGVGWAIAMDPLYGGVVFAGLFFDVVVYTLWLKRRTCWSVVWGGISGGMPILAGRVLGLGEIDLIGVLLAVSVLCWIPTHMLTFSLRYAADYAAARIPTFPSTYGATITRRAIAAASVLATLAIGLAAVLIQVQGSYLHVLGVLSGALMFLAFWAALRPADRLNFSLFKYASLYMLSAMLLLSI